MIKVIAIAVWVCAATLGAVFYSFQAAGDRGVGEKPKPMLGGLEKTEIDQQNSLSTSLVHQLQRKAAGSMTGDETTIKTNIKI